jgi:hypothetical protein
VETIKLTGKNIDSKVFAAALGKLCAFEWSNPKTSYNLSYINKKVQSFTKDILREHGKLVEKYAKKNEEGKIAHPLEFEEDNETKYITDLGEIHTIEHTINKRKLVVEDLASQGFKFSANDISALEPLLCGLED